MHPRLPALLVILGLAAPLRAGEPLTLADGTPYDRNNVYKLEREPKTTIGHVAWVTVAGYKYRAKAGPKAADLEGDRLTKFMERGFIWQTKTVEGETYVLLTSKDPNAARVEQPYGWVPRDLLIDDTAPRALPVKVKKAVGDKKEEVEVETGISRKGMIVNTMDTVLAFQKKPPPPLFTVPLDSVRDALTKKQFPPALKNEFTAAGIELTSVVRIEPRPGKDGWLATMEETAGAGGVFTARQQYDLLVQGNNLVARDGQNMAWVYDRPLAERKHRRKSFILANVFFIFRERDGFALIGSVPAVADHVYKQAIHGWVELKRLSLWNTTEALEWDRASTLPTARPRRPATGVIFASAEAARDWMTKHARAESLPEGKEKEQAQAEARKILESNLLARESTLKGESRPLSGMEMRYPLLGIRGKHPATQSPLFEVGWFGPFVDEGGGKTEDQVMAARRDKILKVIQEIKTVELLFVIDGTGSMYEYRTSVVPEVVAQCLRELNDIRQKDQTFADLRVRATAVLFGVEKDGSLALSHSPLSNGQNGLANPAEIISPEVGHKIGERITELAKWLRGYKKMPKVGDSELEPVFSAIRGGIKAVRFSEAARKHLIFLGDMGDRSKADTAAHKEIRTVVANLLQGKAPQPINFMGIQLEQLGNAFAGADLLKTQLALIHEEINRVKDERGAEASVFHLKGDPADLNTGIRTKIRERFDKLREELRELEREAVSTAEGSQRAVISPVLRRHYKANGIDIAQLAAGGVQVYEVGYASRVTLVGTQRVEQLRPVYLVPVRTARKLRDLLLEITDDGRAVNRNPDDLRKLVENQLMALTKTDDPTKVQKLTIGEVSALQDGLRFKTRFLQLSPEQITEKLSDEDCVQMLLVCRRLHELLQDGTESDWRIDYQKLEGGGKIPNPVRVRRKDTSGNDLPPRQADRFYVFPSETARWVWLDQNLHVP